MCDAARIFVDLLALLRLFRLPESLLIGSTGILTLIMLEITEISTMLTLFAVLFLGAMGIFSWNDSLDLLEDQVAHPERPIVQGIISIPQARILGSIFLATSFLFSFIVSVYLTILGLVGALIGIGYSLTSKSRFVVVAPMKNIVVTLTTALFMLVMPFIFERDMSVVYLIFVVSLAMLLFGYEVLKDIRDIEGDSIAGYQTVPILRGVRFATHTAVLFFSLSCLLISVTFFIISYDLEAVISLLTSILVLLPFIPLYRNPVPLQSDSTRIGVVGILLVALSAVGGLLYLRAL